MVTFVVRINEGGPGPGLALPGPLQVAGRPAVRRHSAEAPLVAAVEQGHFLLYVGLWAHAGGPSLNFTAGSTVPPSLLPWQGGSPGSGALSLVVLLGTAS